MYTYILRYFRICFKVLKRCCDNYLKVWYHFYTICQEIPHSLSWFAIQTAPQDRFCKTMRYTSVFMVCKLILAHAQHYFSENDPERNSYKQHYLDHSVHISVVGGLTYKVFLYITEPPKYKSAARRPLIPVIVDFRCRCIPRRCCSIVLSTCRILLWSNVLVIGSIQYFRNEDSISYFYTVRSSQLINSGRTLEKPWMEFGPVHRWSHHTRSLVIRRWRILLRGHNRAHFGYTQCSWWILIIVLLDQ